MLTTDVVVDRRLAENAGTKKIPLVYLLFSAYNNTETFSVSIRILKKFGE